MSVPMPSRRKDGLIYPPHKEVVAFIKKHGRGTKKTIDFLVTSFYHCLSYYASQIIAPDYITKDDLVSAAHLTLCRVAKVYNPHRGTFTTLLSIACKRAMIGYVKKFSRIKRKERNGEDEEKFLYRASHNKNAYKNLLETITTQNRHKLIRSLLVVLDDKEPELLAQRFGLFDGSASTLKALRPQNNNVSREMIRLYLLEVMKKLRAYVSENKLTEDSFF